MRRVVVVVLAIASLVPALARAGTTPPLGSARLDGQFLLAGRVIKAVRIRGEYVGQRVLRTWRFTSICSTGQCARVSLVRQRASGTDRLTLARISPGYYEGNGKFFAPLRCGRRTYRRGESVPFTIQVRVRAAQLVNGAAVATRITATYTNRGRRNLTPCVAFPGHDKAFYHGHMVAATAAQSPGPGPASALSPAGS
jgi:hypothetical protein